jgi:hypothetical protein
MTPVRQIAPEGYVRYLLWGADVVVALEYADAVRDAFAAKTLYGWAEQHPQRRDYRGRGAVYGAPLPGTSTRVVVRHSRHGGLLAPITRDLFFPPTRAPYELEVALRLREAGVPTPDVLAYAIYPFGPIFRRADVVTREITGARDFGELLLGAPAGAVRRAMLEAVGELLQTLTRVGARHPDLNVKNVLITIAADGALGAHVLDVDRIVFGTRGDPRTGDANLARLTRSMRKWRETQGAEISDAEITSLAGAAS